MLKAVLVVVIASFGAQSQPPAPSPPEQRQEQQQEAGGTGAATNEQNTAPSQSVVVTINQPPANQQTADPRTQPEQENQDPTAYGWLYEVVPAWVQAGAAIVLLFLTGGLIYVGIQQRRTSDIQARILNETLSANQVIERAYVTMSHYDFSGYGPDSTPTTKIRIQNYGRTPANITEIRIASCPTTGPLPSKPPYPTNPIEPTAAFLVAGDHFDLTPTLDAITPEQYEAIEAGQARWRIIGYVDYIDTFGKRHRAGYARVFDAKERRLVFERQRDYNYDKERERSEGNDWEQPERSRATSQG